MYGGTPLLWAASEGQLKICQLLVIEGHANINSRNEATEATALHWAAGRGEIDLCHFLLDQGAGLELKDLAGETPLFWAVGGIGSPEVCRILISRGANLNATNFQGETPLHDAVKMNRPYTFRILLESGARIDIKDKQGKTAVEWITPGDHAIKAVFERFCLTSSPGTGEVEDIDRPSLSL